MDQTISPFAASQAMKLPRLSVPSHRHAPGREHAERGPDVGLTGNVVHVEGLVVHAHVVGGHVEQAGIRRVGGRLLVLGAERGRADVGGVHVLAVPAGAVTRHDRGPSRLHVDVSRPVDGRVVLLRHQQLAGHPVEGVTEAVAVEVHEHLAHLAVDLDVGEDVLVDAVVVPLVVGRHLVGPARHSGIRIPSEEGHRPLVVSGAHHRVPGAGVAGAVVDEVQLGVVGVPAPGRASADLPLVALPRVEARVRADRLQHRGGHLGIDQHLFVGTGAVCLPDQAAVVDVVGGEEAAYPELASADAGVHLVTHHDRGVGIGLADRRIAVHRPSR